MKIRNWWLFVAGWMSVGVGILHIGMGFSRQWSAYFGAPPQVLRLYDTARWQWYALLAVMVGIFVIWGMYGLSGSGRIRRLPLLRPALIAIGGIYTLRGLALFPEIVSRLGLLSMAVPPQEIASSLASLTIGVCYVVGVISRDRSAPV